MDSDHRSRGKQAKHTFREDEKLLLVSRPPPRLNKPAGRRPADWLQVAAVPQYITVRLMDGSLDLVYCDHPVQNDKS